MTNITSYSLNLSGECRNDKETVVYMNGSIDMDGNITISKNIINKELYEKNKEEILKEMTEFDSAVYAKYDSLEAIYSASTQGIE